MTAWLVWLAPLVGILLVVAAYRAGYEAELGSRAGAEPEMAGVFVSLPFVTLAIVLAGCATATVLSSRAVHRRIWVAVAVALTLVGIVVAFVLLRP